MSSQIPLILPPSDKRSSCKCPYSDPWVTFRKQPWITSRKRQRARNTSEFRARLMSMGLRISTAKEAPGWLRQYVQSADPHTYVRTIERIGWLGGVFVLPTEIIGRTKNGEIVRLQGGREPHLLRVAGTLDEWRRRIAYYCQGNSLLSFAVSCAFAAPLLPFTGEQSGGFHLVANTTVGKTTILMVGGSVWGGGGPNGFLQSWHTTANALEDTAECHNHCLLCLDELKLIDPVEASKVVYSLSNGQSKGRLTRELRADRRAEWQLLFLSTGELSLATHVEGVENRYYGGQAVRFCEIPASVGEFGAFEMFYEFASPKALADYLKEQVKRYYGTAARAFLGKLVEQDSGTIINAVNRLKSEFLRAYVPETLSAEVRRAADRFALVAAAGEFATRLGITGWIEGTASGAVAKCFDAWRRSRGTDGNWDEREAIAAVRQALLAHGDSRFQCVGGRVDVTQRTHNRLGFKNRTANSEVEYLLKRESLAELCRPYPLDQTITALSKAGLLVIEDKGTKTVRRRVAELGPNRSRFIAISSKIFDDEHASLDLE
jgi:putative DNA primase/helicase